LIDKLHMDFRVIMDHLNDQDDLGPEPLLSVTDHSDLLLMAHKDLISFNRMDFEPVDID